jgi:hypothetical protein
MSMFRAKVTSDNPGRNHLEWQTPTPPHGNCGYHQGLPWLYEYSRRRAD